MPETLYLIDGHAQIFRAYFAIRGGMRSPVTSEPTHAVFGFTAMLIKLLSQFHPHYVAVAMDSPGKTFRDDLFEEYKGTREKTPDDLIVQIPRIVEVIRYFGIPIIAVPGLEADDVIATIAQRMLDNPDCSDVHLRLVSKDKDLEQLLCDRISMFDIHTDTTIDTAWLKENKGVTPEQVIDLLALTGDTVDNVPGVEGVGPKTAAKLVQEYGSIDGILANLDKLKGKLKENLEKARPTLPLSRKLVTLERYADFPFSLDEARVSPIHLAQLIPLFQQLGFNRFQDDVRSLAGPAPDPGTLPFDEKPGEAGAEDEAAEDKAAGEQAPGDDASVFGAPVPEIPLASYDPETAYYRAITTRQELEDLAAILRTQPLVSVDTETTSLRRDSHLCGICLAWQPGEAFYVPTRSPEPDRHLDTSTALEILRPVLEDPAIAKCGHNIKFDAAVLLRSGIELHGVVFDSMLAGSLTEPDVPAQLDHMAQRHFQYRMIPISDLIGSGDNQVSVEDVPLEKVTPYAAEDADITLRLARHLMPRVDEMGMGPLLRDVEAPLTTVLARMEANGILCDPDELARQGEGLKRRADELRRQIQEICGCEFHVDSTKQLAEILFDKLGLTSTKKTKTGRSTDIEVLERLASQEDVKDPKTSVPRLVIEYRQLTKLISTYLGNLRDSIDAKTGRIHSTFHQLVTATGRLASHNPNLQNIPVRTDIGRQIRKAFFAPPGHSLICADYSQIELRLLAHLSDDAALLDAFERDMDIHTAVAAQVFNVPLENVSREQRAQAKTINFGIIYGVTPYGLARRIEGLDVPSARKLIEDYRLRFTGIDRFLQTCVHCAMEDGYVKTILGRRRAIPEIYSNDANRRGLGERLAINSVVQGSAADLIKAAMVNVQRRIDRDHLPLKLLLQIHDELVLESPAERAEEHAAIVREEMEHAMHLKIPLRADAGIGPDWMTAK